MMKVFLPSITLAALVGCSTTPASPNPPPPDEFTAVSNHTNAVGSQELAQRQAIRTCKHWGATPGITSSKTINLATGGTIKEAAQGLAKDAISGQIFDKKFPYETTITYKCHQ